MYYLVFLYNVVNLILLPLHVLVLFVRVFNGKENYVSLKSRFGFYSQKRDDLDNKLLWIHAASIGESSLAITLTEELKKIYPKLKVLITTGTVSSADIIIRKKTADVYHEFRPLDNWLVVRRFYRYWQPDIGIFIESEIWPTLLTFPSKKAKLLLLNGRLSDKSFKRWQKIPSLFAFIANSFCYIAVQSFSDFKKYKTLGCRNVENLGNLKFANKKLPVNAEKLDKLQQLLASTKVFVAASTHREDEAVLLKMICEFKKQNLKIYSILILRHPERARQLETSCTELKLKYATSSDKPIPNLADDVYIVNSFGELGLFFSVADVTFVGGSFSQGGHNLLEPAYFDNVIIVGPDMTNYRDITNEMIEKKAVIQGNDLEELERQVAFFFKDENKNIAQEYSNNAKQYVQDKEATLGNYLNKITQFL